MRGLLFVVLGLGIGAVGVRTAVAARYAAVDRVDNVPSIWLAAAACIGALATLWDDGRPRGDRAPLHESSVAELLATRAR